MPAQVARGDDDVGRVIGSDGDIGSYEEGGAEGSVKGEGVSSGGAANASTAAKGASAAAAATSVTVGSVNAGGTQTVLLGTVSASVGTGKSQMERARRQRIK